jgi:ELWxxDGT repeat protein
MLYYADVGASMGGNRNELVASNGTAAGTRVLDINTKPNAGSLNGGINGALLSNVLVFAADDGTHGGELWRTDGTVDGTSMVKEFIAGPGGGLSLIENRFISFDSVVLFGATDNVIGSELWKTDGTPGGTVLVKDIRPGSSGSQPNPIARIGNKVIMLATTAAEGRELWVTDGTAAGTQFLADTNPGAGSASVLYAPLVSGNKAYIAISTPGTGRELWVTDGTPAGTHITKDIRPGAIGSLSTGNALLAGAAGRVYFAADDGIHGVELWVSDGTDEGTRLAGDLWPGLPSSFPSYGALAGSTMYFDAYRPEEGDELWAIKVCPADFDDSGFIDIDDFGAFVAAFVEGGDDADFDGSGFVDLDDFVAFVGEFETGC